jgi:hypothetical protein
MRWIVPIVLYLVLAFDGTTHWDENNYLFKAAYAPFDLGAPWIHGLGGFYSGRLVHIGFLHLLFRLLGTGLSSVLVIKGIMAVCVILTGFSLSWILRKNGLDGDTAYWSFLVFVFSPLGLYLGAKALAETTALLPAIWSIHFLLRGRGRPFRSGLPGICAGAVLLLVATNARVESLLAFVSIGLAWAAVVSQDRWDLLRRMASILILWGVLTAVLWAVTGASSLEFIANRGEAFESRSIARDRVDYPPNYLSLILLGGAFWLPALLALVRWRDRFARFAWVALLLALAPILIGVEHNELRYYHPAVFAFALAAALGLVAARDLFRRHAPRMTGLAMAAMFLCLVGSNQCLRPLHETGVEGFDLVPLVREVAKKHPDPLIYTASVPNTDSFLRVVFPKMRIASQSYDLEVPLDIRNPDGLHREKGPWIFLDTSARTPPPLAARIWKKLKGVRDAGEGPSAHTPSHWMMDTPGLVHSEVARRGRYAAYLVQTK